MNKGSLIKIASIVFVILISIYQGVSQGFSYDVIQYPAVPSVYSPLSEKVDETSGLIFYDGNVWTFNDSHGEPEIYRIDKASGEINQTVLIENASNIDWEDITHDESFIYVGDFGNNYGNRKDLKIYKIAKKDIGSKKKTKVSAGIIAFSYQDQGVFVKNNRNHNFDCESLISSGDSLIIFSKNWDDGQTRMYKLPKESGTYKISPVDSYKVDGLITGADINDNNELLLIGYKDHLPFVYLFTDFIGKNLHSGNVYRVNLPRLQDSQTEGVIWYDENNILFSTEQTKVFEQQVFQLDIKEVVKYIEN